MDRSDKLANARACWLRCETLSLADPSLSTVVRKSLKLIEDHQFVMETRRIVTENYKRLEGELDHIRDQHLKHRAFIPLHIQQKSPHTR